MGELYDMEEVLRMAHRVIGACANEIERLSNTNPAKGSRGVYAPQYRMERNYATDKQIRALIDLAKDDERLVRIMLEKDG